ncbi:MAG: ABC transporter permease [Acidobacteria bacterium]|nr:ABC transporter permease [Acidobacteriota bacterium]
MAEWRRELERRCTAADLDPRVRDEVEREIAEHLEDRVDDLLAGGASAAEAGRAVMREIPDGEAIRRLARSRPAHRSAPAAVPPAADAASGGSGQLITGIGRDLLFGWRSFRRDRAFTTAAIVTLAACLAANVVVFTLVNAVLIEAVDVPEPEALVQVGNQYPNAGAAANAGGNSGVPDYFDRRTAVPGLAEQALFRTHGVSVGDQAAERLVAMTTTPTLFPMVRAQAAQGRTFTDDEGEEGRHRKVVLSDALWRRRFGAAAEVVGQALTIGGVPHEIVGIMPRDFRFYDDEVVLWLPAAFTADERSDASRHSNNWTHVGRLAPGTTLAVAQAQIDALNAANLERFPALRNVLVEAGFRSVATPLVDVLVADVRRPLYLLWGGVACVLLIGVVNLAALTLARSTARRGEIATRLALGAAPARVRLQLVTEHLSLAAVGGLVGVAAAWALIRGVPGAGLALVPDGRTVPFDPRVWAYAAALTVLVGVALGAVAMQALAPEGTAAVLRDEGRSRTGSRATRRLRQALVVGQVAVACTLLVGAGILFMSFRKLLAIDTGFRTSVVTGAVALPAAAYPTDPERLAFLERLLDGVRALPGVEAAGATTNIPFGPSRSDSVAFPEGWTPSPGQSFVSPYQIRVSPGYFESMGIPAVAGRTFDGSEVEDSEPVVIVDEQLAGRFWPGRDAVGRYLLQPRSPEALSNPTRENMFRYRVVGVVRTVKQYALVTPSDAVGSYYFPFGQNVPASVDITVQSAATPAAVERDLRRVLASLDPRLPLYDVLVMRARVDESLRGRRATMTLALAFGGLALGLSALGLYGVLAYLVAQRTREIGIRMALGGSASAITSLVLRESLVVVGVGLAVGLGGAIWLGRWLAAEMADVGGMEPTAILGAVALLLVAALVATAAPARRALRVDPAVALAAE